jgi:hypothetical protein
VHKTENRSTICDCTLVACRCNQGAPDALKHGCFPATPLALLKLTGGTAAPPVRVAFPALEFISTLQYRGGGGPSDTAAGALQHVHAANFSGTGVHSGVQLMLLSEAAQQHYVSFNVVPMVSERTPGGERSMDMWSLLLQKCIIFLQGLVSDECAASLMPR